MNTKYVRTAAATDADTVFETSDRYLKGKGYRRINGGMNTVLYRKGIGISGPPRFISVERDGKEVMITAWRRHAVMPGVFMFDVRRRSRRLETEADVLTDILSGECKCADYRKRGAVSVISVLFGILSGISLMFPAIGIVTAFAGIVAGTAAFKSRSIAAAAGLVLSSFFFSFSVTELLCRVA